MKAISKLAFLTSLFIFLLFIFSLIIGESLYFIQFASYKIAVMVAIISICIHIIALFQEKVKKLLIKFSLLVPSAVIVYFIIGFIYWLNKGI